MAACRSVRSKVRSSIKTEQVRYPLCQDKIPDENNVVLTRIRRGQLKIAGSRSMFVVLRSYLYPSQCARPPSGEV